MMLQPFPAAPQWVRQTIDQLKVPPELLSPAERASLRELDRPWDPAGCSMVVRAQLWPWLDDVAGWLNHEYGWQTAHSIPSCWPLHPHLVHELAVLACLRIAGGEATSPHMFEEWHRYALPGFLERMADRLGPAGCQPPRHLDWPAKSRYTEYTSPEAVDRRNQIFEADTGGHPRRGSDPPPPPPTRPPPPAPRVPGTGRRLSAVPDPDHGQGVSR